MSNHRVPATAWDLFRMNPAADCCDCGTEAAERPEEEIWIIWHGRMFYCPRCAQKEGIA